MIKIYKGTYSINIKRGRHEGLVLSKVLNCYWYYFKKAQLETKGTNINEG